jgi:hypothetical protein
MDVAKMQMDKQRMDAEVQRMLEEARLKAEMQPYDIESKQAASQYSRAMAQKMLQPQVSNEERTAKAEEIRRSAELAKVIPMLERMGIQLNDDTAPQLFQELQGKLKEMPPEVAQYFGSPDKMSMSKELLDAASRYAREQHPELAKNLRTTMQQEGATSRNDANIASRERLAEERNDLMKQIADAKAKDSGDGANLKYLAESYQKQAEQYEMEKNQVKADMYFAMARRAASVTAMKNPASGKQSIDTGKVANLPTTSPVAANANQPERSVEVVRDPKTGKLVRK